MRKPSVILAIAAAIGGAVSMVLAALAPRNEHTFPILLIATIITLGALSSAMRFARQSGEP